MALAELTADSPIIGLRSQLERELASKHDYIADTRHVEMTTTSAAWLRGEGPAGPEIPGSPGGLDTMVKLPGFTNAVPFVVTEHAHGQISEFLKIPKKHYDRLRRDHPDLLEHLTNGLLEREPKKRLLRTMDGKLRAFLSDGYRPRDNWDLMDQAVLPVLEKFGGQVLFHQCALTETRMYVKIALPGFEKPVTPKVGDVIQGGLLIENSEVGASSLKIAPWTLRLDCLNGMTHLAFGQKSRHVGGRLQQDEETWEIFSDETLALDDAAFFAKCRDTVTSVLTETVFDRIVEQMREMAGMAVEGPPNEVVEVFAARHGLTQEEQGSMLTALVDSGDRSGWGYLNALTQTARDHESVDRRADLEALAGDLLEARSLRAYA